MTRCQLVLQQSPVFFSDAPIRRSASMHWLVAQMTSSLPISDSDDPIQIPSLPMILREWGRIGCIGFGGPPTHIRLLRELCVEKHEWINAQEFEDGIAACNLLPGPASTQLAIFCAWRIRGRLGGLIGGIAFILPGLALILILAWLFLSSAPPLWVLGIGAGAGAAIGSVALYSGTSLLGASWKRRAHSLRWLIYLVIGAISSATAGSRLVLVLLTAGLVELLAQGESRSHPKLNSFTPLPFLVVGGVGGSALISLAWVAFKVGALSYGGGFVIIPLMQSDAVNRHHWMTSAQFLTAVALGQITPGPVVQSVAVIGYAAAGLVGGLLAALIAFGPSFVFVLVGAKHFDSLRTDVRMRAFLDGAGPASIGAILGSAIPLISPLTQFWQHAVLVGAAIFLFALRRGVVLTLAISGIIGLLITVIQGTVHH
jgi:chromate transporter